MSGRRRLGAAVVLVALAYSCSHDDGRAAPGPDRRAPAPDLAQRIAVTWPDGRPVTGRRFLWTLDQGPGLTAENAGRRSRDAGVLDVRTAPAGSGRLALWISEGGGWRLVWSGRRPDDPLPSHAGIVVPPRPFAARVRVRGDSGEAVRAASLRLVPAGDGAPHPSRPPSPAGEDGFADLTDLADRAWHVDASAPGFAPERAALTLFPQGETPRITIVRLRRGAEVASFVADARTGRRVPGARICVSWADATGRGRTRFCHTTDGRGAFAVTVPRAAPIDIVAEAPGYASLRQQVRDMASLDIRLTPLAPPPPTR